MLFDGHGFKLDVDDSKFEAFKGGFKTAGSAGFDLCWTGESEFASKNTLLLSTGTRLVECDPTLVGLVFIRSGLAAKHGLHLVNSVGVIDSDYRDEIRLILWAHSAFPCSPGDRVAQIVFTQFRGPLISVDGDRNGGFGSTGK